MQTKLLIGWPSASGQGSFTILGKSDLSTIILSSYTSGHLGDITGKGKGAGKGAARAVGAGEDEAFERAARAEVDVARSAWIADLIGEEKDLGRALLLLAGGREAIRLSNE